MTSFKKFVKLSDLDIGLKVASIDFLDPFHVPESVHRRREPLVLGVLNVRLEKDILNL